MTTPKYLRVTNWTKYQHYKDRTPPWIKLYNSLLDDYAFCSLPDASKAHFLCILLAASRHDNCIPLDSAWLARFMSATESIDLGLLVSVGLLAPCSRSASKMLATCKQSATPETERETEVERETETTLVQPRRLNGRRAPLGPVKPSPLLTSERTKLLEDNFTTLYGFYPRHVGKEAAWKAFLRLDPDVDTLREIARDVKKRTDEGEWIPSDPERVRFIPHLASYLNQRRWTDER
jgi:hypothetical protein